MLSTQRCAFSAAKYCRPQRRTRANASPAPARPRGPPRSAKQRSSVPDVNLDNPRRFRPMPTQQRFHSATPEHHLAPLTIHPFHLIGQLLLRLAGRFDWPRPTASLSSQLGDDRGILAIVLRRHAIKDFRIIRRLLGTDAMHFQAGPSERLPQRVAISPRWFHAPRANAGRRLTCRRHATSRATSKGLRTCQGRSKSSAPHRRVQRMVCLPISRPAYTTACSRSGNHKPGSTRLTSTARYALLFMGMTSSTWNTVFVHRTPLFHFRGIPFVHSFYSQLGCGI